MSEDFRPKFKAFSDRMVGIAPRCANEESTKLFLILPFLNFLGYDDRNPDEVCPEHSADYSDKYKNKVDFVILKDGTPIIAIECKAVGAPLLDERGQLRAYFNADHSIKMGILTDGLVYEFYADSDDPHIMDQNAFLVLDMKEIAKGKVEDSVEEGIKSLQKANFDPENIGAEAKRKLIFHDFVCQIRKLAEEPSELFVRMLLRHAGVSHVKAKTLSDFMLLTKNAFREYVNLLILERLELSNKNKAEKVKQDPEPQKPDDTAIVSPLEAEIFQYIKRRLAFLVEEDMLFEEIDKIEQRKYKGKFVVYYKKERVGRLFNFYEGGNEKYCFDFGDFGGEISTNQLVDIDDKLLSVFKQRVNSGGKRDEPVGTPP